MHRALVLHASRIGLASAILALVSPSIQAATVTATFTGVSPGLNLTVWTPSGNSTMMAGKFNWTQSGGGSFSTFCIELPQSISSGNSYTYTTTDLSSAPNSSAGIPSWDYPGMGAAVADEIAELFGRFYNSIGSDATKAAAFQVSIWNLIYDRNVLVTNNSSVSSLVSQWTSALNGTGPKMALEALTSTYKQDQVRIVTPPPNVGVVPEPGTMALWGIGAIGMLAIRRRRVAKG